VTFPFGDFDEYWRYLTAIPAGLSKVVSELSEEDEKTARGLLEERTAAMRSNGAYRMPGVALNVLTT
jgi:hypothetical protein